MRCALVDYAAAEAKLAALNVHYGELGDDTGKMVDQDGDVISLTFTRDNARARVQTYAAVVQAECALRATRLPVAPRQYDPEFGDRLVNREPR
jgi:hypothetical protein